jgi:V/A-type H+-transporting ATPase subunit F
MYKVAVMGDRDSIYGFAAIGLDTYPIENTADAAILLKKLAGQQYAVIYITENLQAELESEINHYVSMHQPAIIPIPGVFGNTGMGMRNVKKSVERAVGSDIIFNND